jgi:hypothetical protein
VLRLTTALAAVLFLVASGSADAKTKAAKKASGLFCEQGGRNFSYSASRLKPGIRARLVVGKVHTINIPGYGPYKCRVY